MPDQDMTKDQLIDELAHLRQQLAERVKELNCLLGISRLVEKPGLSLEEIIQGIVALLPPAWQYPEVACGRIVLDGQEFRTENYAQTAWKQASDILVRGERAGAVEVCYLEARPKGDEGLFLKEERDLIDAISERVGRVVERKQAEAKILWDARVDAALSELYEPLISHTSTIRDIANVVLQHARDLTGSTEGYVSQIDPATGDNVGHTLTEMMEDGCRMSGELQRIAFPRGDDGLYGGLWGHSLNTGEVFYTNAPETHPSSTGLPPGHVPLERFLSVPVTLGEELVGQIALANPGRDYADRELEAIQRLADFYALAIQRIRNEGALLESEARWRSLTLASPDHILTLDTDLKIRFANFASPGLRVQDLLGIPLYTYVEEERQAEIKGILEGVLRTGGDASYETVYEVSDGPDIYYESRVTPRRLPGSDEIIGLTVSARDVTERKRMEVQLREYTEHLEQMVNEKVLQLDRERAKVIHTAKLASLGEMATGIAHELNQPLTAMLFDADYLKSVAQRAKDEQGPPLDADELYRMGEEITADIARCRQIIDHLRAFSRVSGRVPSNINLNRSIEGVFVLVGERLRQHGVAVKLALSPDLPSVLADINRLEQVFLNLVSNAEYALAEMEQEIKAGKVERPGYRKELEIATFVEGDTVVATVRDNGVGIVATDQEHIFEPFFTTKPVGEGTGLGLSISYGIVNEYGGEISFESVEKDGTSFTVRFPAQQEAQ